MGKSVSIIGLGFVGLSMAVVSASKGYYVIGVDVNEKKISDLNQGMPDFFEPELKKYLDKSIRSKKIKFTTNLKTAILESNLTFLCVGTPLKNGKINLDFIEKAINDIKSILEQKKTHHTLVLKSTAIPQTTTSVIIPALSNLIKEKQLNVVVNPEFLQEGKAIHDVLFPHLIVIGRNSNKDTELDTFYKKFYSKMPPVIHTDPTSAELIKYANNAFLATKISFINSLANLCQNLPGTDIDVISKAIGMDPRIGSMFLQAGPGFGGSCLPKDLRALISFSEQFQGVNSLFKAVDTVNKTQPKRILDILSSSNLLNRTTISILGLAFKKNTDDVRDAVSITLVNSLLKHNVKIRVHDPMAIKNFKLLFGNKIEYHDTIKSCLDSSDCCIILTEWDEYSKLGPKMMKTLLKKPNIIDTRRILEPGKFSNFNLRAMGRGT